MTKLIPGTISKKSLMSVMSKKRGYVSSSAKKLLKEKGLGSVLYGNDDKIINRVRATKVLRALQEAKEITSSRRVTQIFDSIVKKEKNQLETEQSRKEDTLEAEKQKHIQARLKMDLAEETEAIETGKNPYDPRTALGKSVTEEIAAEKQKREKKITTERLRRSGIYGKNPNKQPRPELANTDKLLDLDIG